MTNTVARAMSPDNMTGSAGSNVLGYEKAPRPDVPQTVVAFNYRRPAELFPTRSRKPRRNATTYKRFDTAAAAVRFAIEELPSDLLLGAYLQVEEERFGSEGIRQLYDSERYPLKRRAVSRS